MSKIEVTQTVDVPDGSIFYDLPASQFVCIGCGKREKWDLDAPATRGNAPSEKVQIKNFLRTHARCFIAREVEVCCVPAPPGFGCTKQKGHAGPCDP